MSKHLQPILIFRTTAFLQHLRDCLRGCSHRMHFCSKMGKKYMLFLKKKPELLLKTQLSCKRPKHNSQRHSSSTQKKCSRMQKMAVQHKLNIINKSKQKKKVIFEGSLAWGVTVQLLHIKSNHLPYQLKLLECTHKKERKNTQRFPKKQNILAAIARDCSCFCYRGHENQLFD